MSSLYIILIKRIQFQLHNTLHLHWQNQHVVAVKSNRTRIGIPVTLVISYVKLCLDKTSEVSVELVPFCCVSFWFSRVLNTCSCGIYCYHCHCNISRGCLQSHIGVDYHLIESASPLSLYATNWCVIPKGFLRWRRRWLDLTFCCFNFPCPCAFAWLCSSV
jgi:hypothetical protein